MHPGWLNSAWSLNDYTSSVKHNNIEMKLKTPIFMYINERFGHCKGGTS